MTSNRVWLRGFAVRADDGTTAEEGPIPFVAANEGRMADGIDLRMDTADLARFAANPVVMYGHDYWGRQALPIGRAPTTRVDGTQLLTDLEFDLDDPFAADVDRKIRRGYLNAVSIGFSAYDIGTDGVPARWELFEISVVPLPMDPGATAADGRDGRSALTLARSVLEARELVRRADDGLLREAAELLGGLGDPGAGARSPPRSSRRRSTATSRHAAACSRPACNDRPTAAPGWAARTTEPLAVRHGGPGRSRADGCPQHPSQGGGTPCRTSTTCGSSAPTWPLRREPFWTPRRTPAAASPRTRSRRSTA
ncbi:HK97 family phage prohead protease [Lentzea guizhouensis]|uniref:HK97 family phage prohead protease n=1 Tax=Lentzea guizhouensis TaxID=1586287 RepID=UPI0012B684CF|nr:HK97 family phage prohead protease [Lentzea guizhouensis]